MGLKSYILLLAVFFAMAITTTAQAQGKAGLIGSYKKWDAMKAKDRSNTMCYMISTPTKWRANKKNVRRGDIYFTVTTRPSVKIKNQMSVTVGYPLRTGSEVTVIIDGKKRFKMFTQGDTAWTYAPRDDKILVDAMRAGSTMQVIGTSSRGTRTTDTYSLSGFTAANNAINRQCR